MKSPQGYCDDCGERMWGTPEGTETCLNCDIPDGGLDD